MKRIVQYLFPVLIMLIAIAAFAIFFAIPKAAALAIPFHWNNIPVGQKKFVAYQYLGGPANPDSNFILKKDEWHAKRDNGEYILSLTYNNDTIVSAYQLSFLYHLGGFRKKYLLREK